MIGERLGSALNPRLMNLLVGVSLIAMALWALQPERVHEAGLSRRSHGLFFRTLVSFLIAEMGDKTQIATAVLAAAYGKVAAVAAGSSLGIVLACAPAVLIGHALSARLPLRAIRVVSSLLFLALGVLFLVRAARGSPEEPIAALQARGLCGSCDAPGPSPPRAWRIGQSAASP
ncbi:protein belonging to Uncharacterized protein family UPF0016 [mine drainage metagenome]|uniref:Protein belonging to Uncharacterized protein family UPF0016 n=1 Tax=mine drainage metagenome TaxID=410659 RepID=T1ANM9_9ZZZZ